MTRAGILLCAFGLSGCVFYPHRIPYYDKKCEVTSHKYVLDAVVITDMGDCSGEQAKACLIVLAAVGGASAVVSGSIVVVGNTIYWLERQGDCRTGVT